MHKEIVTTDVKISKLRTTQNWTQLTVIDHCRLCLLPTLITVQNYVANELTVVTTNSHRTQHLRVWNT